MQDQPRTSPLNPLLSLCPFVPLPLCPFPSSPFPLFPSYPSLPLLPLLPLPPSPFPFPLFPLSPFLSPLPLSPFPFTLPSMWLVLRVVIYAFLGMLLGVLIFVAVTLPPVSTLREQNPATTSLIEARNREARVKGVE